jgi:hypothetical protein
VLKEALARVGLDEPVGEFRDHGGLKPVGLAGDRKGAVQSH